MTTTRKPRSPQAVRRYELRRVIRVEVMANWKLRLYLDCEHVAIVTSSHAGETARCYRCGEAKNLEYEDEM